MFPLSHVAPATIPGARANFSSTRLAPTFIVHSNQHNSGCFPRSRAIFESILYANPWIYTTPSLSPANCLVPKFIVIDYCIDSFIRFVPNTLRHQLGPNPDYSTYTARSSADLLLVEGDDSSRPKPLVPCTWIRCLLDTSVHPLQAIRSLLQARAKFLFRHLRAYTHPAEGVNTS